MGCGKTTLGKRFASKMDYAFIDLDHQLEVEAGMSVGEFFAEYGEAGFRAFESKVLKNLSYPENCVVATGGGAPCYFDNMDFMNNTGITVYIEMPPLALAKRLENGKHKRPLIKNMNEEELIGFITAKLDERNPFYTRATISVGGIDINPEQLKLQLVNSGLLDI